MTQTFSEILEEKLATTESIIDDSNSLFYSGMIEPLCLSELMLQGFHIVNPHRVHAYKTTAQLEPDYAFNPLQLQAVSFFNQHLQGSLQLKGAFSNYKLQRVYRLLAKKLHPDLGGSGELFRELHTGYKILLDFLTTIK